MSSTLLTALTTLGAAIIGGLLTAVPMFVVANRNRQSEELKHSRSLIFMTAVENWKIACDACKITQRDAMPLDVFIIHMFKLWDVVIKDDTTADNVAERLRSVQEVTLAAEKSVESFTQETREGKI